MSGRADERLEEVIVRPGKATQTIAPRLEAPTFAEAVTNPLMFDAWLQRMGKDERQRATIIRELKAKPTEILGTYRPDQIGHAELSLFRDTLQHTRTRHGIRKQLTREEALLYKTEMRRLA